MNLESPVRVMITDDHLIVREGLRLILETSAAVEVVGEASDGGEALALAAELHPQVILMDLQMPGMDGLTAIQRLAKQQPETAVVILTTYNEDDLMYQGLQAGARGYLLKDTDRETLLKTILAAARGETLLKPEILSRALAYPGKQVSEDAPTSDAQTEAGMPVLTEREMQVLQLAAQGLRSKEMAFKLGITERTIKAHLSSIYQKLGVDSRAAAIAVAAQQGLLM